MNATPPIGPQSPQSHGMTPDAIRLSVWREKTMPWRRVRVLFVGETVPQGGGNLRIQIDGEQPHYLHRDKFLDGRFEFWCAVEEKWRVPSDSDRQGWPSELEGR